MSLDILVEPLDSQPSGETDAAPLRGAAAAAAEAAAAAAEAIAAAAEATAAACKAQELAEVARRAGVRAEQARDRAAQALQRLEDWPRPSPGHAVHGSEQTPMVPADLLADDVLLPAEEVPAPALPAPQAALRSAEPMEPPPAAPGGPARRSFSHVTKTLEWGGILVGALVGLVGAVFIRAAVERSEVPPATPPAAPLATARPAVDVRPPPLPAPLVAARDPAKVEPDAGDPAAGARGQHRGGPPIPPLRTLQDWPARGKHGHRTPGRTHRGKHRHRSADAPDS